MGMSPDELIKDVYGDGKTSEAGNGPSGQSELSQKPATAQQPPAAATAVATAAATDPADAKQEAAQAAGVAPKSENTNGDSGAGAKKDAVAAANDAAAEAAKQTAAQTAVPSNGSGSGGSGSWFRNALRKVFGVGAGGSANGQSVPNPAGKPPATISDAVQTKQMELENALRMKGIETALEMWKAERGRAESLQDRELAFEEWKQRNAIQERDRIARLASTSFKRSYHGTFSGGFLSSSWAGPKENPYKGLLDKLEREIGGNPYASARENQRSFAMPDWLKPLLPNGTADQRKSLGPGVQSGVQGQQSGTGGEPDQRGTSTFSVYQDNLGQVKAGEPEYRRAGRTLKLGANGRTSSSTFDDTYRVVAPAKKPQSREQAKKEELERRKKINDAVEAF